MTIKRTKQFSKSFLLLLLVCIFTGCSNKSPEEAINNGWSDEIKGIDVLSKQKIKEGTIALFTAQGANHSHFENVGVALLNGQSDHDWEFIGSDMTSDH